MRKNNRNKEKHGRFLGCSFKDNRIEFAVEVVADCYVMDDDDTGLPLYSFKYPRIFVEKGNDEVDVIWKLQHNVNGNLVDIDGNIVKAIDFLGCKIKRIIPLSEYNDRRMGR